MRLSVRSASARRGASTASIQPARCCWSSTSVSARQAASPRRACGCCASRSLGTSAVKMRAVIVASPSAEWRSDDLDTEPRGEIVERVAGEIGLGDLGEQPRVERARRLQGTAARSHSRLSTARSKPMRMADEHRIADKGGQFRPDVGESRRIGNSCIVDAMDARWRRRVSARRGAPDGGTMSPDRGARR